jgi:tetratricopeptide (TPR) repeat protein
MKLLAFVTAIALLLSADSARQTFESAMQALNSGDYPSAEAGFNKVLASDASNVSALANLGVLYAKTHRYGKSIEVYQRVLRISPQLREIQLDLGLAYLKQEDYVHALPYFQKLHARSPSDHQATMLLATCLTFSGHPDQGLNLLKPLTDVEDPEPAALYLLGVAYSRVGQSQAAQDVFTKLFAGSATPAQTNFLLGQAYYDAAQFYEAEQAYRAVLQTDQAFSGTYRELGKVYISLHKNEDAETQLKLAIAADPQDASAFYFLGALLVQSQRYEEGLSYLEKSQTMTPDSWATYFYMGKAQFQRHDTAAAVHLLRQAVEMNPEDAGSYYLLARALRAEGHLQEANAAMQHVAQLHTSSLDAEKHALKEAGVIGAH